MRSTIARLGFVVLLIAFGGALAPAAATVVIGNYPPTNDNTGTLIDEGYGVAAGFTMPAGPPYSLTSATVRINAAGPVASFSARLFGDAGGNPVGPALLTFTAPAINQGNDEYVLTPNAPFVLQPSTTYWLVLRGDVPSVQQLGLTWLGSLPHIAPTGIATSAGYRQDTNDPPVTAVAPDQAQPTYRIDALALTAEVPTLGGWSLLALAAALALAAVIALRPR